jgi:hypothetical protein
MATLAETGTIQADTDHVKEKTDGRIEQRVSFVEARLLAETIVTGDGHFRFAVAEAGKTQVVESVSQGKKQIVPSYSLRVLWDTGLVRFPSGIALCGSTEALIEEIKEFISRYANLPAEWLEIIALYILMTWVYDRFTAVPYLRFLGEPGTGKTRLLLICAAISYKGMVASGNITGPALFRTIDLVRGTMAVDEADFRDSQEWSDIIKVLNNGYTPGTPVIRCGHQGEDFEPRAFFVYGPKIISTRSRFADEALESRCLTLETREGPLPAHIPLQLPLSFEKEALTLRNKLLKWRFDNFHLIDAREGEMRDLFPRSGQIGASLAAVAPTTESRSRLVSFLSRHDAEQREDSPKGIVLQALGKVAERGGSAATVGELAEAANEISRSLGADDLTAKRVGGILRSLGIIPRRTKNGYVVNLSAHKEAAA